MRIKIIKKILAIMISASILATTPGLAGAFPRKDNLENKFLGKKTDRSKTNSQKDTEPEEEKEDIVEDDINQHNIHDQIENIPQKPIKHFQFNVDASKLNLLLNKNSYCNQEKYDFLNAVENLISSDELKNYKKSDIWKISNILINIYQKQ